MKATLTFDLPEDEVDYTHAVYANRMAQALWAMNRWIRNKRKYGDSETVSIEEVAEAFRDAMEDVHIPDG